MKKIFTLITSMLLMLGMYAQSNDSRNGNYNQSKVTVSSLSNRPVRVVVDGNNYNARGNDNEILISNLAPGYHTIKIYQQKNDKNGGRKNNRNMQIVYDATLNVRPQYHIDIVINRFGKSFADERQMNAAYYSDYEGRPDETGWNNNNQSQAMNTRSFDQFRQTLRNENFDNTRLVLAKQTIASNYFSAPQVKELLQLFSFENSKLEIAEYAYRYTLDKNNYFLLNDAFAYSGSKEELARYIKEYK